MTAAPGLMSKGISKVLSTVTEAHWAATRDSVISAAEFTGAVALLNAQRDLGLPALRLARLLS
jgi:hypothetical protein